MNNRDRLKKLIDQNNGIIKTCDLKINNIHRQYLKIFLDEGYINKIDRGVYCKIEVNDLNEFYLIGCKYKNGVFSHNTALYFYNLTDRTPLKIDMTFPDNNRINNDLIIPHYKTKKYYDIGLTNMKLSDGTIIKIYNIERTICDIIKDKNKIDSQIFNYAIKSYFSRNDINLSLLYEYAQIFKIKNKVKMYMEVLSE